MENKSASKELHHAKLAVCSLNQWALDFEGNKNRIIKSIELAKSEKATIRLGPELETCGYGCEDHFLESDTIMHSWQILGEILSTNLTNDILCCFGLPVIHRNVLYNCAVLCLNKKILLIRPKLTLADDGIYREGRYFTSWKKKEIEMYQLEPFIADIINQLSAPFGHAILQFKDTDIGIETCEELWSPQSTNIELGLEGVEIFLNNSGSHFELQKLQKRINLIADATSKNGGIYLYSNQIGVDSGRCYYDGACMIFLNGQLLKITDQFSMKEVEVATQVVNLNKVREQRISCKSRAKQTQTLIYSVPRIEVDFKIAQVECFFENTTSIQLYSIQKSLAEEIAYGTACFLWDYLRRSGATGYFLPLSGGADSSSVASMIYQMSLLIFDKITQENNQELLKEVQKVVRNKDFIPKSAKDIVKQIFFTTYMGTQNSSDDTRNRAKNLAMEINCNHFDVNIDQIYKSFKETAEAIIDSSLNFESQNGSRSEDIALQNIQARSRMVLSYLLAQIIPAKYLKKGGFLLVLGSANLDEGLRGYCTKYDCSSADINPIGDFSKNDLKQFLQFGVDKLGLKILQSVIEAKPTAELKPLDKSGKIQQTDEEDMGMTYNELSQYGYLRKVERSGPFSMMKSLIPKWETIKLSTIIQKVKHFFVNYSINRHKMTTMTPAVHAQSYSTDDNRFDLRPFLYNNKWDYQFKKMDEYCNKYENQIEEQKLHQKQKQ